MEDDLTTCKPVVPGAGGCKDGEKFLPLDGVVGQPLVGQPGSLTPFSPVSWDVRLG